MPYFSSASFENPYRNAVRSIELCYRHITPRPFVDQPLEPAASRKPRLHHREGLAHGVPEVLDAASGEAARVRGLHQEPLLVEAGGRAHDRNNSLLCEPDSQRSLLRFKRIASFDGRFHGIHRVKTPMRRSKRANLERLLTPSDTPCASLNAPRFSNTIYRGGKSNQRSTGGVLYKSSAPLMTAAFIGPLNQAFSR